MQKADLPVESGVKLNSLDLDLPDLPGDWDWRSSNHLSNGKVNVYFGLNSGEPGGWLGEIDNYVVDGEEQWTLHVRPIVENGTEHGIPRGTPETAVEHDSLEAAVEAVPDHIVEHYGGDE